MDKESNYEANALISKDKALEMLFVDEETKLSTLNCFDEYGNYLFPTDFVVDTPNTAVGTPLGFSVIRELKKA